MIYKKYYINVIIRVIIIALLSLFMAWYYIQNGLSLTLFVSLGAYILLVGSLISYHNKTNRSLAFFFDAVKNEDSTLVFSEKTGSPGFNAINSSLNLLNRKLQETKIEITVQEKYYKAIVESAATAIMVYDSDHNVQLSNSSMNKLLGIESLHNINQVERICPNLSRLFREIEDGDSKTLNTKINNSSRYLLINSTRMTLRAKTVKLIAVQDISYELDRQEIDSWQKLIRILNHEIMNSVAPITSLSSTLSGFFKKENKAVLASQIDNKTIANTIKGLSIIEEHGNGLINFVESYRSLTKLPRPAPVDVLVSDIFDNVSILSSSLIETYKSRTGKHIDISFQVNPGSLSIFADRELISRVILNLVKNAIEAFNGMDHAGVFLEAGMNKAGKVWIRVIDNGPGIPDSIIDNIFVPFYTTKDNGNGIGLSLCRQIIIMHKGSINIFSNPGEGTNVLIVI
ncbi:MAG: ATP-binding protein [Bacteroidales bacterium]|nr:ATP-binding protein [Bacteroidales bacterium]